MNGLRMFRRSRAETTQVAKAAQAANLCNHILLRWDASRTADQPATLSGLAPLQILPLNGGNSKRSATQWQNILLLLPILLFLLPSTALSQSDALAKATTKLQADLEASAQKLAWFRSNTAKEKAGLSKELMDLQVTVKDRREEWDVLRTAAQGQSESEALLRRSMQEIDADDQRFESMLLNHRRALTTRLQPAEAVLLEKALTAWDTTLTNRVEAMQSLLDITEATIAARMGGNIFNGNVVSKDGRIQSGPIAQLGPLGFFAGDTAGRILPSTDSTLPGMEALPGASEAIRLLTETGKAELPIDLTGKAEQLVKAKKTFRQELEAGGAVMIPLAILGVLGLITILIKTIQLFSIRLGGKTKRIDAIRAALAEDEQANAESEQAKAEDEQAKAKELVSKEPKLWREVLTAGLPDAGTQHAATPEQRLERMQDRILATLPKLERWMVVLAIVAAAAPLLGLLGTVSGMMVTFSMIEQFGTGNTQHLTGGISEALVTTKYGLIIAIPALIAHALLNRRIRRIIGCLDGHAMQLVSDAPAVTDRPAPSDAPSPSNKKTKSSK